MEYWKLGMLQYFDSDTRVFRVSGFSSSRVSSFGLCFSLPAFPRSIISRDDSLILLLSLDRESSIAEPEKNYHPIKRRALQAKLCFFAENPQTLRGGFLLMGLIAREIGDFVAGFNII